MAFRKLGEFIELINERNSKLIYGLNDVMGVNNAKELMFTKAKSEYADLSKFYIVKPGEFVYNPRTSRNGDKVGLAFNNTSRILLFTFNNIAFRIKDNNKLNSEYLYLIFKDSRFDKYARYNSWGSATELFSWDDFCKMEINVPDIAEQERVVKIYNVINNRIKILNALNKNLEEQAQTIFKNWFIDFEFPNEEGKPYKSSGGKMIWNEELQKEIPEGWKSGKLGEIAEIKTGKRPAKKSLTITDKINVPVLGASSVIGFTNEVNYNEKIIVIGRVGTLGVVQKINFPCWASDNTLVIKSNFYEYVYQILKKFNYANLNRGTTQPLITQGDINKITVLLPKFENLNKFENIVGKLVSILGIYQRESQKLAELRDLLLPKLLS